MKIRTDKVARISTSIDEVKKENLQDLYNQYSHFFDSKLTFDHFKFEFEVSGLSLDSSFNNLMAHPMKQMLWRIKSTFSASNASAERGFSSLEFIKSKKRAAMGQERGSDLLIIYKNSDLLPTEDEIFQVCRTEFGRMNLYIK